MLLLMRELITAQLNVVLGFQKHLFLSDINNFTIVFGYNNINTTIGNTQVIQTTITLPLTFNNVYLALVECHSGNSISTKMHSNTTSQITIQTKNLVATNSVLIGVWYFVLGN